MLKLVNSVIAMILYSIWMIKVWEGPTAGSAMDDSAQSNPWFIYNILGFGITLCVVTCCGHTAAETANGFYLYMYMFFVILLLTLEAAVAADLLLNSQWEQDFPDDLTGNLEQLTEFVRSNFEMFVWIGLSIVSIQGLCIPFALLLKALGPHPYYNDDDKFASGNAPLLRDAAARASDSWSIRTNEKVKRGWN